MKKIKEDKQLNISGLELYALWKLQKIGI